MPFHFALAEKNSVRARDIHLYNKLRQFVKTSSLSTVALENEIYNICTELKTVEIKVQTLDMLVTSRNIYPEWIYRCIDNFLHQIADNAENEIYANFKIVCQNLKALLDLYLFATSSDNANENSGNIEENNKTLNLETRDLEALQKLLDLSTSSNDNNLKTPHVKFLDDTSFAVTDFLGCFDVTKAKGTELKNNLEAQQLFKTSEVWTILIYFYSI